VSCGYPISTHNPRCAVHMALSRLSASAERHVQKLRMMYRAYVDTGRPQCGNSMRMHYHLSQPTGQPLAPAAKQITLPEASSVSSSLTAPKAEHTLKSPELGRDVPKSSVKRKHKSESLEYTDPRVTAERQNLPALQTAWAPARLGQTVTQTSCELRISKILGGTLRSRPVDQVEVSMRPWWYIDIRRWVLVLVLMSPLRCSSHARG
jgi:hypothetical protein